MNSKNQRIPALIKPVKLFSLAGLMNAGKHSKGKGKAQYKPGKRQKPKTGKQKPGKACKGIKARAASPEAC